MLLLVACGRAVPLGTCTTCTSTCASNADCGSSGICGDDHQCTVAVSAGGLSISSVSSDLGGGIIRNTLIVTGTGFDATTGATLTSLLDQTVVAAPVMLVQSTEIDVAIPAALAARVNAAGTAQSFILRVYSPPFEAAHDVSLLRGAGGDTGAYAWPVTHAGAAPLLAITDGASANAHGIVLSGESATGDAVFAATATAPAQAALFAKNDGGGVALQATDNVDVSGTPRIAAFAANANLAQPTTLAANASYTAASGMHLPIYVQMAGAVAAGGTGATAGPPSDIPAGATPGVAYCRPGDFVIGGGCVADGADFCPITRSSPVSSGDATGRMGWACRSALFSNGNVSTCAVTASVNCLKAF